MNQFTHIILDLIIQNTTLFGSPDNCEVIAGWSWGLTRASGSYGKSIGSRIPLSQDKV
jgi:hypothetical protein